ncbi:TPA: hypothetical protein RJD83_002662 [Legionella pneumophila]|nr:hypothetical protein [Legionella pneumophila]
MLKEDWEEILSQFELSGLTQKSFCAQNNLSHKQFVYRWNSRNRSRKRTNATFENITVLSKPLLQKESSYTLRIHLANKIHCEVTISLSAIKDWMEESSHVNPL